MPIIRYRTQMAHLSERARNIIRSHPWWRRLTALPADERRAWDFRKHQRILSLSPHPDDDVIGWGGWMHRNHLEGNSVTSVCLTDGSAGGGTLYEDERQLVQMRKSEAEAAARLLGISGILFWDEPDGKLKPSMPLLERLHLFMKDYKPHLIVVPSFLDDHPDHHATADLLARHLLRHPRRGLACLQGEIWTPLPHWNTYVSIDSVLNVKRRAIEAFSTQLSQADFVEAFLGLARYRGVTTISGSRFVECFLATTAEDYIRMWRAMRRASRLSRLLRAGFPIHRQLSGSLFGCSYRSAVNPFPLEGQIATRPIHGG